VERRRLAMAMMAGVLATAGCGGGGGASGPGGGAGAGAGGSGGAGAASGGVAKVGAILSLSGVYSTLGPPEKKAMTMGLEALN